MNVTFERLVVAMQEYVKRQRGLQAVEYMYAQTPIDVLFAELNSATLETEKALGTLLEIEAELEHNSSMIPVSDLTKLIRIVIE
jgi:response regulator of citrate/malate metabolism